MTWWALESLDARKTRFLASVAFRASGALVLEDTFLPVRVSTWWAVILILVVDDLGAHDRTPFALGAGVPIIAPLWANVTRLAATAVRHLSLCGFDAHGFKWAASWVLSTLLAIVTFGTLTD